MGQNFDLLGDPIPDNFGGRGRPAHIPTSENRNRVMLFLALNWSEAKVAASIGVTPPTLRKHYFRELKVRGEARARVQGAVAEATFRAALAGKITAIREISRQLNEGHLQAEVIEAQARLVTKPAKLGKKEERQLAAERVGGIYTTPQPPRLVADNT